MFSSERPAVVGAITTLGAVARVGDDDLFRRLKGQIGMAGVENHVFGDVD